MALPGLRAQGPATAQPAGQRGSARGQRGAAVWPLGWRAEREGRGLPQKVHWEGPPMPATPRAPLPAWPANRVAGRAPSCSGGEGSSPRGSSEEPGGARRSRNAGEDRDRPKLTPPHQLWRCPQGQSWLSRLEMGQAWAPSPGTSGHEKEAGPVRPPGFLHQCRRLTGQWVGGWALCWALSPEASPFSALRPLLVCKMRTVIKLASRAVLETQCVRAQHRGPQTASGLSLFPRLRERG